MPDFATGVRFLAAVGEAGDTVGHHPMVTMVSGCIDLRLTSSDAIYRDEDGTEYVVEWVTQQDVDLARRISEVAADQGLVADPTAWPPAYALPQGAGEITVAPVAEDSTWHLVTLAIAVLAAFLALPLGSRSRSTR